MNKKLTRDITAEDFAYDIVWSLHNDGLDITEINAHSLNRDQLIQLSCLIHIESNPQCRHEALSSGDNFDCYGELMIHNPSEFIQRMQDDFVEYYMDHIDVYIDKAIVFVREQLLSHYQISHSKIINRLRDLVAA